MSKLQRYSSYKESGVEWIGEIPEHWELKRLGSKFIERKQKVSDKDFEPLSVTKYGVVPQLDSAAKSNDGDNRKLVKKGDFVINSRSDRKGSSGISPLDGSVSLINITLQPLNVEPSFCNYLLRSNGFVEEYYRNGHGIVADLWTTRYWDMKSIMLAIPPKTEQTAIASFLDEKTIQIDQAISQKEKMIELLKERRQIVINEAVRKGINPNAPMKESGVEWIEEIPEHWEIRRAKYLFKEIDERSKTGKEELLSVSHMTGVTPRSEKNVSMFMSEDYTGSKTCKKDDLVMNIMWAWMGALGVSAYEGIVSSSYAVYRQTNKELNSKYIEYLLKSLKYIEHYNRVSTGLHSSRLRFYSHMFMSMKIGFPSIDEQFQIVNYIEEHTSKIDAAIELQQKYITKLKEYKETLVDSAVTGKVRVA